MLGTCVFLAACGALVAGVTILEKKKNERNNKTNQNYTDGSDDNEPEINVRRGLDYNEKDLVKSVNREFRCGIKCDEVEYFVSPNYETEYTVNGKKYISYQTLQAKKEDECKSKYGCNCDRIVGCEDSYGNKVIELIQDIPCFDSGDREYDSDHLLFLFHNDGQTHALYCGEGYRIATLILFKNVTVLNMRLKQYMRSNGFPS